MHMLGMINTAVGVKRLIMHINQSTGMVSAVVSASKLIIERIKSTLLVSLQELPPAVLAGEG